MAIGGGIVIGVITLWMMGAVFVGATLHIAGEAASEFIEKETAAMQAEAARAAARRQREMEIRRIEVQRQQQLRSRPVITECVVKGVRTFDQTGYLCQQQL